jgi:hypothetical protein
MEIVLHASENDCDRFILEAFQSYLSELGVRVDLGRTRYVGGLSFLPVRVHRSLMPRIGEFSFLRVAREMPHLRMASPMTRSSVDPDEMPVQLPDLDALDPALIVSVLDGGTGSKIGLERWVKRIKAAKVGKSFPKSIGHGSAVTSAVLFGALKPGEVAPRPFANVHHVRVVDMDTGNDDQGQLYTVLDRVVEHLKKPGCMFANLSLGPDLPVDDDDVHLWTAKIDEVLSSGDKLVTIAAGNSGERDKATRLNRIQPPSDAVNVLSVGACDTTGHEWDRAPYSSIGPGRSPGYKKPDLVAFGGCKSEPFWALSHELPGVAKPFRGTSFAAPLAMRSAVGMRAIFGSQLKPLTLKALLVHHCDPEEEVTYEVGWGRVPCVIDELILCPDDAVTVVYQGELQPAKWVRAKIPIPAEEMLGRVKLTATICYATKVDPQDAACYTRSGLEVVFRPHDKDLTTSGSIRSKPFFSGHKAYETEEELRLDGHKWETVRKASVGKLGSSLRNPVFDLHYTPREGGRHDKKADIIRYALVVTVKAANVPDLYNRVIQRYRTVLAPLVPQIQIPLRIQP